ncbi:FAD-binding protein [Gordonia jinghuaiqii]|uniref:FAD-binding protein n=1 Tax=Gordonia jinghuaiqii TaxID=2758710 RepID=A0A7D7RS32_9ACTN|nr:D-arabinono-1,4-lactone oxidase [Gordonia jinghuaiqii]MCR5978412.1 FAD-binding protein [Gordonia jinghuaiqii]QMT02753.1 FAD-binding protein [Gordonia jinghuaiqii]
MFPVTGTSVAHEQRWRNWGGTAECTPARVLRPSSVAEVTGIVRETAERGGTVKTVGAGHSFSPIAVADDVQLELSGLRGLVGVDGHRVALRAGTHLHEIPGLLAPFGLGMANLGDVDRQTIAGATSTGTHGTGLAFGGISTQIVGATIVTGTGDVVTLGPDDADLAAVALGLGALGVVVELTIECVEEFRLHAVEGPASADDAIASFLDRVASSDHHEFYLFPHTNCALVKTNTRVGADTPVSGPSRIRRYIDDELLSNKTLRLLCEVGSRAPRLVPAINGVVGRALSPRELTDASTKVFVSERDVRFREMEYAIDLDAVPDALREIRALLDRRKYLVSFPIEVRAAAADDLMLSTAAGRTSGYIAVHRYHRDDPADTAAYFADVEAILTGLGGRPHWGKMHTRDAEYLRSVYPRFDEFLAVRDRYDPSRVFANDHLRRVLGE